MAITITEQAFDRARRALSSSNIWVLRNVLVEQVGDALVLSGSVDSYYHKQMAQEVVRHVAGDIGLENRVDVIAE